MWRVFFLGTHYLCMPSNYVVYLVFRWSPITVPSFLSPSSLLRMLVLSPPCAPFLLPPFLTPYFFLSLLSFSTHSPLPSLPPSLPPSTLLTPLALLCYTAALLSPPIHQLPVVQEPTDSTPIPPTPLTPRSSKKAFMETLLAPEPSTLDEIYDTERAAELFVPGYVDVAIAVREGWK